MFYIVAGWFFCIQLLLVVALCAYIEERRPVDREEVGGKQHPRGGIVGGGFIDGSTTRIIAGYRMYILLMHGLSAIEPPMHLHMLYMLERRREVVKHGIGGNDDHNNNSNRTLAKQYSKRR